MRIDYNGFSEQGNRGGVNQDAIGMFASNDRGLFLVSDGMGGHTEGERASREIREACRNWWEQHIHDQRQSFTESIEQLKTILALANRKILEGTEAGKICGATVVMLFVQGVDYALIWCGDSRCYMLKKGIFRSDFTQLTIDDTWENEPDAVAGLSEDEIRRHPNHGKLVRAVGVRNDFTCHTYTNRLEKNVLLTLCSDGIYKYTGKGVLEDAMKTAVKGSSLQAGMKILRTAVYNNGAPDNMSCILVKGIF